VCALVRSLIATKSMFLSPSARAHDVATDAAEAVDADPNRHAKSSRTNVSFYNKTTAMYLAYSLLTLALFVVVSPYFLYQAIRYRKYIGTLRQRLGFLPITFNIDAEESIWIHAVVGGRGAHRSGAGRRSQGALSTGCVFSCRPPRSRGSRWRGAASPRSTRCSTSRSTGPSSSAAPCGWCGRGSSS